MQPLSQKLIRAPQLSQKLLTAIVLHGKTKDMQIDFIFHIFLSNVWIFFYLRRVSIIGTQPRVPGLEGTLPATSNIRSDDQEIQHGWHDVHFIKPDTGSRNLRIHTKLSYQHPSTSARPRRK